MINLYLTDCDDGQFVVFVLFGGGHTAIANSVIIVPNTQMMVTVIVNQFISLRSNALCMSLAAWLYGLFRRTSSICLRVIGFWFSFVIAGYVFKSFCYGVEVCPHWMASIHCAWLQFCE